MTKYETKFYFQLFSEASVTSNGPAAKRVRNDSIDAIEPNSKKRCETVADVKHDVETKSKEDEQTSKNLHDGGKCISRSELPCGMVDGQYRLFCIVNAANSQNFCSSTYRAPDIKRAFNEAYITLSKAIENATNEESTNVLNRIVSVSDDIIEYRKWIRDHFDSSGNRLE